MPHRDTPKNSNLPTSSSTSVTEEKSDNAPLQTGRFTVTKVPDIKSSLYEPSPSANSILIPVSFFDNHNVTPVKPHTKYSQRISYDEFKSHYMNFTTPGSLTLYEDDTGNVDTVKGVLMKTVIHKEIDHPGTAGNKNNLGTFFGVFLPCCQNIVGVIYFVRFPWIVGCAGILEAGVIVLTCNMMSICTAVSMSAIATNGKITAGGTYFMISRSLGPTFGGSVGFLFFMGTSISVSMYYLGTVETLLTYVAPKLAIYSLDPTSSDRFHNYRIYGTIQLLFMSMIAFAGVKCVSRFSCCAIVFLILALCSIILGIATASPDRSVKVCALGERLIRKKLAFHNNTWQCNKNYSGPIYEAYCKENDTCEKYFLENEVELISGVPGFSIQRFLDNLHQFYTEKGDIPGTKQVADPEREIVTDIRTSFVVLFAIYFPSITGVESGSNFSGDLQDPQVSIPLGTMLAVAVTSSLYLLSVGLMGGSVEGMLLRDKYGASVGIPGDLVLSHIAWPTKWVVVIGTLTATVGAGLQALAGGPRLLQAIAEDNIIPHLGIFARKWHGEPIRGLMATFIIAEIGILIAFLDYVAPIVTMFFLLCYGFINFAVTLQSLLDTPHWRPGFKYYHWSLTLLGTALCVVTMFICEWTYAVAAITLAFLLYQYIEYKGAEKEWGDGITGFCMTGALYALRRMKQDFHHTKNWRPQILVLLKMDNMDEDETVFKKPDHDLVMLADMMKEGKGLTMFATVIKGLLAENVKQKEKLKQHLPWLSCCIHVHMLQSSKIYINCLSNIDVTGFIEVITAPSLVDGLCCMVQSAGLGVLRPNTIIMAWPYEWSDNRNTASLHVFLETMRNIALTRNALVVLKASDFPSKNTRMVGTIDIWWIVNDGGMLLLLGHLLRRNKTWIKCQLRLFTIAFPKLGAAVESDNTVQIKEDLQTYLYQLRIEGIVNVVEMAGQDMSAYVYERTLKMEERTRMINYMTRKELKRSSTSKKIMEKEVQQVLENARSIIDISPTLPRCMDGSSPIDKIDSHQIFLPLEMNIRNMNTAVRLNSRMKELSKHASLVILNLPCVPESSKGRGNYMSFLEVLTEGLNRLLLVRGTGSEVITVYN